MDLATVVTFFERSSSLEVGRKPLTFTFSLAAACFLPFSAFLDISRMKRLPDKFSPTRRVDTILVFGLASQWNPRAAAHAFPGKCASDELVALKQTAGDVCLGRRLDRMQPESHWISSHWDWAPFDASQAQCDRYSS